MTIQSLDVESDYFGVNCAAFCPLFPVSPVLRGAVHMPGESLSDSLGRSEGDSITTRF